MKSRSFSICAIFAITPVCLLGCATLSNKNPNHDVNSSAAAARSEVYLKDHLPVPYDTEAMAEKSCAVPAEAQRLQVRPVGGPSSAWKNLLAHANACVRQSDWQTLETLALAIARSDVDSPWGAFYLSLAAEGRREFSRAIWMIDLAQRKAGGQNGLFEYQKGRIQFSMNDPSQALKTMQRAVALDPRLVDGFLFLADIHSRDLELDLAIKAYQGALAADGNHPLALVGLAESKLKRGDPGAVEDAVVFYSKAVTERPERLRWWLRLADLHETGQKNPALALTAYRNVKSLIDRGRIRERPDFDLVARIKSLEERVQTMTPSTASTGGLPSTDERTKTLK